VAALLLALVESSSSMRRAAFALVPRAATLRNHRRQVGASPSLIHRWMSATEPPTERTEEEKEAIKAVREAQK
jgi:hypothetical protein